MTFEVDLLTLVILLLLFLLAGFLLPMIWQLKKTGRVAEELLSEVRKEIVPTVRELRELAERTNRVSAKLERKSGDMENLFDSIDEIVDSVHHVSTFLRKDVNRIIQNAAAVMLGIKVAGKVFLQENRNKTKGD